MLGFIQWLARRDRFLQLLSPLLGKFNPLSESYRRDPHPMWRNLRETAPIYRSRAMGGWVATRYEDVSRILRDPNFTADRSDIGIFRAIRYLTRNDPDFSTLIERNLLMLDGPEHRQLRGLVSKAFTARRVQQLRPRIQSIVDDLLERAAEHGEMKLVRDFAHPVPVVVIAELLGVPAEDREFFHRCSNALVQLLDPLQGRGGAKAMSQATHEIFDYFRPLLEQRRREPQDDLLSAMIGAEEAGEMLAERDLLALSTLLLVAGHETTTNLIGNGVLALLQNPGELKRLREDPSLMPTAVDECLRYAGPIVLTDRLALDDCEIAGQPVKKGSLVVAGLAAANRDPDQFPDPDRFDVGREPNRHLALGQGNHFCMGAQLARLETEIAIGSLIRRFPEFEGPTQPEDWRRSMVLRGPTEFTLRLY